MYQYLKLLSFICLNKFHNIELNSLTKKILSFWEKDFEKSINKHINFLKENIENQNIYSSKFSEIFQEMDIFQNEEKKEIDEQNQDKNQNNPSNENQDSEDNENKEKNKDQED